MKVIPLPDVDDKEILQVMSENSSLKSFPFLRDEKNRIVEQYDNYENNEGNPWECIAQNISEELKEALEYHYKNPIDLLSFIKQVRQNGSPDVCPMCGSLKTSTLDHFLPKADYPEFNLFSRNLIPACDCNIQRRNDVKGDNRNERVLHPYYDTCLNNRIVSCKLSGDLNLPTIEIIQANDHNHNRETIEFHLKTVVMRSSILSWLESKWIALKRSPYSIIVNVSRNRMITKGILRDALRTCLLNKDEEHGTPNNWYSIFFHGILNTEGVDDWLVDYINSIVAEEVDPFVD